MPTADPAPDEAAARAAYDLGLRMTVGVRSDGSPAHVSEVGRGLACDCSCPGCGTRLVARKGSRRHHFAHHGSPDGRPCATGPETALHLLAKDCLARALEMELPALSFFDGRGTTTLQRGRRCRFESARLEKRLGRIVPDVLVSLGGRELIVEFAVTHRCDGEKVARIEELGIAAVEVDLSKLPRAATREDLEAAILFTAPRHWVHHPKEAEALRVVREREATRYGRLAGLRETYARHDAAGGQREVATDPLGEGLEWAVGLEVSGAASLDVTPRTWQATLLLRACRAHAARGKGYVNVGEAVAILRRQGWIREGFDGIPVEDRDELAITTESFGTPEDAVESWARELVHADALLRTRYGWRVTSEAAAMSAPVLAARGLGPSLRDFRRARVEDGVLKVLALLSAAEAGSVSFDGWISSAGTEDGVPVEDAVEGGGEDYDGLVAALDRLVGDVRSGSVAPGDYALGLPVHAESARRGARRAAERQAEEARWAAEQHAFEVRRRSAWMEAENARILDRVTRLETLAVDRLGADGLAWSARPCTGLGGLSPMEMAARSEGALASATIALDFEVEARG